MPRVVLITGYSAGIRIARLDVAGMSLRPDVVRELGDAVGDRAAIAGLGDAVVERGEDARVVRYERAEAHRKHDGDNQRQDAAHDPGDGLAVARGAPCPSPANGNGAE